MVNALQKKVFRDIGENRWSFISIVCVCMLGIALFSGINLYVGTISNAIEQNYESANLADYWLYKADVTETELQQLQAIPIIQDVQRRKFVETGVLGGTLRIHGIDGAAKLNIPELVDGEMLDGIESNALLLDSRFADAHGLRVGDIIQAFGQSWTIQGIVRNVEYIYYAPDGLAVPDYFRYGFAYINAEHLPDIPYNEIVLSLSQEVRFSDAEIAAQIREALGAVNIMSKQHQSSYRYIEDDLAGVARLGIMFPVVFFLTAALVTWVTVGRMMDSQRQHLGTLRSLGFSRKEIMRRYTLFGIFITIPSMILGWCISRFLADYLYQAGTLYYTIEITALDFLNSQFILAVLCVAVVTCGATFLSCRKSLKCTPATLMRPKPPAQGHRILLERIPAYWNRLSFSGKIVTRNLFRNKVRMIMGIVGVVGSAALIVCGFGMKDTTNGMLNKAFGEVMQYDVEIKLKSPLSQEDTLFIYKALDNAERIDASMAFGVYLYSDDGKTHNPYLVVLEDEQTGLLFTDLDGNHVPMPENGALITPRMAKALDVTIGDIIEAENLAGTNFSMEIINIVDFPVGNEIYLSRTALANISSEPFMVRAFLVKGENLELDILKDDPRVATVETKDEMKASILDILELLQSIQVIIIVFAGLLAFAVMMVLGRLNYYERIRELATLKVLGFHQKEMKRLVLRENIWIAIMGMPIGIIGGFWLLSAMTMQTTNPDMEMSAAISAFSIILTCVLVFTFTSFINYLLGRKFKTISMVASLKSVE